MVGDKRCVLIIDDDTRILRSLRDFLTSNKFYVFEATDGRDALDAFYEHNTQIDMISREI